MIETTFTPWDEFLSDVFDWNQGEHVSLLGPTGRGKSTLARQILPRRSFVTALGVKPADDTLSGLRRDGYQLVRRWPPSKPRRPLMTRDGRLAEWRVLLWPKIRGWDDIARQRDVFEPALQAMFAQGKWTIYADEVRWLSQQMNLRKYFEGIWMLGRSMGLTLVAGTQRPAWVPLEMYSQATHLFFWQDSDQANLKRIASIGGLDPKEVRSVVTELPGHNVLYVNTRSRRTAVTQVERL